MEFPKNVEIKLNAYFAQQDGLNLDENDEQEDNIPMFHNKDINLEE